MSCSRPALLVLCTTLAFLGSTASSKAQCPHDQIANLVAQDGVYDARLGWSVSIAGDLAVAGAPYDNFGNSGSATIFRRDGASWTGAEVVASDPGSDDQFG